MKQNKALSQCSFCQNSTKDYSLDSVARKNTQNGL